MCAWQGHALAVRCVGFRQSPAMFPALLASLQQNTPGWSSVCALAAWSTRCPAGVAAQHGILIKSAEALEKMSGLSAVVFDKASQPWAGGWGLVCLPAHAEFRTGMA